MSKSKRPVVGPAKRAAGPSAAAGGPDSIAIGLQRLFASVAEEPIPDEFLELLNRIDASEQARQTAERTETDVDTTGGEGIASDGAAKSDGGTTGAGAAGGQS